MKLKIRVLSLFFLLTLFGVTAVATFKPGTALFFRKFNIKPDNLYQENGIYFYEVSVKSSVYDTDTFLVMEGDSVLERIKTEDLVARDPGVFSIEPKEDNTFLVRFIPKVNGSEQRFRVLIQPNFITSDWILYTFVLLSGALMLIFASMFIDPKKREILLSSPAGFFRLFFQNDKSEFDPKRRIFDLQNAVMNIILIAFIYIFMEWIFFVTKPSFMDVFSLGKKFSVLLFNGFGLSLLSVFVLLVIFLLDSVASFVFFPFHKFAYKLPAGLLVTSLGLILLDNFTYTVLGFGVVTSNQWMRVIYLFAFCATFVLVIKKLLNQDSKPGGRIQHRVKLILTGTLVIISIFTLVFGHNPVSGVSLLNAGEKTGIQRPNIILLSNDGLNARNMSVYGYERETTPFMETLAESSLLMQNNYTNANTSTGSDTATLTGKNPFNTRVLYPPNTLQGQDMYEHLPGLLQQQGYRTISLGVRHFVDVNAINFKNGFDSFNCKENDLPKIFGNLSASGYGDSVYFFSTIINRIFERLQHIFFIKDMENPYAKVTENPLDEPVMDENTQLECLRNEVERASSLGQPIFAHIHLISTHGPTFSPSKRVFSKDQEQTEDWMTDFYDDAILSYDDVVQDLVQYLTDRGLFDNTIFVLSSDHGSKWTVKDRIPLMIRFPGGRHAGTISGTTQNLDIAPTLLDYLGMSQPDWMDGESLFQDLSPTRLIFAGEFKSGADEGALIIEERIEPPFYQFGILDVIQCQRIFRINLQELSITSVDNIHFQSPCPEDTLDSPEVIWQKAGEFLSANGYELPEDW